VRTGLGFLCFDVEEQEQILPPSRKHGQKPTDPDRGRIVPNTPEFDLDPGRDADADDDDTMPTSPRSATPSTMSASTLSRPIHMLLRSWSSSWSGRSVVRFMLIIAFFSLAFLPRYLVSGG
jgi:hypothetical protein